MRSVSKRGALAVALLTGVGLVSVGPGTASAVPASSAGTTSNVIVVLHNQHDDLTISKGRQSARVTANRHDESSAISAARTHGARNLRGFDTVNAYAATVTPAQQSAIAADPAVAAIYPDLPITKAPLQGRDKGAGGTSKPVPPTNSATCSTDPSKPSLEPEALQVTNTAFQDRTTPQAQNLYTGAGVKVAFLADGLDINNPDFIRADGSHVFVDYQDFSDEGPNAPSSSAEAFGDASAIAAQGLHTYNIADFAPNSAASSNCDITIRGMAPGASLVGLKVFGNSDTAPTSRFIQAIDYAVNTAGVDVINESFGSNPFPDNNNDPITLADDAAVDAGVTVVASSGDAGTTNTIGSPGTGSKIISVAATTIFRSYLQEGGFGSQLSNGTYLSNNISSLSSGGVTQGGQVPDLAAPGDSGWALCTPNPDIYLDCSNTAGDPSSIQDFGGTSQSSPLVAGAAALVIQAYESTHHGVRPTPALVKRLLTGTAQDLGHPAYEQGAGLVNSLAAVKAAASWADSTATPKIKGAALVVDKTQLSPQGYPGSIQVEKLAVRNVSTRTQLVRSTARTLGTPVSAAYGSVTLNTATAPTYIDQYGIARSYVERDFTVPAKKDRLDVSFATPSAPAAPRVILIDPTGAYAAYSLPQGAGNYGHVDVRYPKGGQWKAYFAVSRATGFNGPFLYSATTENYTSAGVATPVVIPGGATRTVYVAARLPSQPGDESASVQLTTDTGLVTSVPMTLRSIVPPKNTTFTGVFTGGNGRESFPEQSQVYAVDVPKGKKDLGIGVTWNDPNQTFVGVLTAPDGQVYSQQSNQDVDAAGDAVRGNAFEIYRRDPAPGRWTLSVFTGVVSGLELQQPFTVRVAYNTVKVSADLPTSTRTKLAAGHAVQVPVKITNTGVAPQTYFADGRLDAVGDLPLAEQSGVAQPIPLPVPAGVTPVWLVPTQTPKLTFAATADQPVNLDVFSDGWGEPELYSAAIGNGATVNVNAAQVTPGFWAADIGQSGPFGDGGATPGTVSVTATAHTQLFDPNVTSNAVGDIWLQGIATAAPDPTILDRIKAGAVARAKAGSAISGAVALESAQVSSRSSSNPASSGPGPVYLQPGESATIMVTITPSGAKGSKVTGHLYVDDFNYFNYDGDELIDLPYAYSIK